jgi:LEA14-like dessication related protein
MVFIKKIILCLLTLLLFSACNLIKPIEYKGLKDTKINNLSLNEIDVNFKVAIENQNRFKVKVKKCKLFITIENIELGWVELDEKTDLLANQISYIPLNFKVNFSDLLKKNISILSLMKLNKKEITVHAKGFIVGAAKGLPIRLPIDRTEKVNLKF